MGQEAQEAQEALLVIVLDEILGSGNRDACANWAQQNLTTELSPKKLEELDLLVRIATEVTLTPRPEPSPEAVTHSRERLLKAAARCWERATSC